jgi:hypothetical protein
MTRKADICPGCGRLGKLKWYKAQNAIVKKLRKLGHKLRYAKQLVYTHFEGNDTTRLFSAVVICLIEK